LMMCMINDIDSDLLPPGVTELCEMCQLVQQRDARLALVPLQIKEPGRQVVIALSAALLLILFSARIAIVMVNMKQA